jgi:transposase
MKETKKIHLKDCSFTKNGTKYRYFALAEANKVNGKNQKKIIKYIGELTEAQVESYRYALRNINEGTGSVVDIEDLIFEEKRDFLDVAVLHELWKYLGLGKAFELPQSQPEKEVSTAQVAEILTLSKLLKPTSGTGTVEWFQGTYLASLMGIDQDKYNRMKIFNELSSIAGRKKKIEERLFEIAKDQNKEDFEIFFVDGTTTYFEGTHCELGRSGKDKTTGYKSHMILIMMVTDRSGYPCAWDVYEGNAKEVTQFKEIAKRICQDYKITKVTFCFDRGFASAKNFDMIEGFFSRFISGIDKDQIAKVFDVNRFQAVRDKILEHSKNLELSKDTEKKRRMPIDGFYTADGERFYKELGIQGDYRHIAGFSTEIFSAENENREQAQMEAFLKLGELNEELSQAKKDRDLEVVAKRVDKILEDYKMQNLINYTLTPISIQSVKAAVQSCTIHYALDLDKWHQAGLLDGIFIYITDHIEKTTMGAFKLSAYDVTRHYKDKYVIEQTFRDLKSVLDLRPLFVRLPEHVRALVGISVIAQFMNVFLARKLATIGMSLNEFYLLLTKSASVAVLKTPKRSLKKLIQTQPKLIKALEVLGLKDSVFSSQTMAILN